MSNQVSANSVLKRAGLNTPPWRKLRGGAYLHATRGYRTSGSQSTHRHAGVQDDAGMGGILRRVKRFNPSFAEGLILATHADRLDKEQAVAAEVAERNAEIEAENRSIGIAE